MTLWEVAGESRRLMRIFCRMRTEKTGFGGTENSRTTRTADLIPFHEYFYGDNGADRREPPNGLDGIGRETDQQYDK
jgi:hypothetical protein